MTHTRPQSAIENCTWHNFNVVPTYKGYYAVSGNYQKGISVIDFTNPAAATEIAYADPTAVRHRASADRRRLVDALLQRQDLRVRHPSRPDHLGPRPRPDAARPHAGSVEPADADGVVRAGPRGPGDHDRGAARGRRVQAGPAADRATSAAPTRDSGVESCVGTVADGAAVDTSAIGYQTFTVTAKDKAGTDDDEVRRPTWSTAPTCSTTPGGDGAGDAGAERWARRADVRRVHAGRRDGTYNASTTANVISTAGDATLIASPTRARRTPASSSTARSRWRSRCMASATSAGGTGAALAAVGGSSAPTTLLTYTGPSQQRLRDADVPADRSVPNEALRTGTYSKTLTFTLSTTARPRRISLMRAAAAAAHPGVMNHATKSSAAILAALALSAGTAQASQRVTEIPLRAQYAVPGDIVAGPDGAMYTADSSLGKVCRIADNGSVRSYDVGGGATGIASAHGALWVSERDGSQIVKLGLDGSQTSYPVTAGAFPADIVLGSDGALWFTELRGNAIGRLTTDGELTEYPLPTPDAFIADITAGPDGALWFTESSGNKIGRITTAGEITEYALPAPRACRPHHRRPRRRAVVHRAQRQQDRPHDHGRRAHARVSDPGRERDPAQHRRRPRRRALLHAALRRLDRADGARRHGHQALRLPSGYAGRARRRPATATSGSPRATSPRSAASTCAGTRRSSPPARRSR